MPSLRASREIADDAAGELDVGSDPSGELQWKGWLQRFHQAMAYEHLTIDDDNLIRLPAPVRLSDEVWGGIQSPGMLKEHLDCPQTAINNEDPSLVIGPLKGKHREYRENRVDGT